MGLKTDGVLTGMLLLLLAGQLLLEGAPPVELHAPLLLLCQGGGWGRWGGVDQPWQVL